MAKKKQGALPGMEDMVQIRELDEAAVQYAGIRDERMRLTGEEVQKRDELHELMKKHGKMKYKCEGISIERVPGEESIKVKVDKDKPDKQAA